MINLLQIVDCAWSIAASRERVAQVRKMRVAGVGPTQVNASTVRLDEGDPGLCRIPAPDSMSSERWRDHSGYCQSVTLGS